MTKNGLGHIFGDFSSISSIWSRWSLSKRLAVALKDIIETIIIDAYYIFLIMP
jgi:hypothetical protein